MWTYSSNMTNLWLWHLIGLPTRCHRYLGKLYTGSARSTPWCRTGPASRSRCTAAEPVEEAAAGPARESITIPWESLRHLDFHTFTTQTHQVSESCGLRSVCSKAVCLDWQPNWLAPVMGKDHAQPIPREKWRRDSMTYSRVMNNFKSTPANNAVSDDSSSRQTLDFFSSEVA